MKPIRELKLGFGDAENYRRRENKDLFNTIFVKNDFLDKLLDASSYFLIGEKGTGKTAYSVFLNNNEFKDTLSHLKYLRETDYQKFVTMKTEKHLQLSDYASIWKVIILLLLAKSISIDEINNNPFARSSKIKAILQAVDDYYQNAFAPEILYALKWIEDTKAAAELITKYLKLTAEGGGSSTVQESRFQVNLLYVQHQLEGALSSIKLRSNHILFIDGIDIRPGTIPYADYLECVKGLANAVWSINNDFFSAIKDSPGRFRAVLLVRPDIFNSIGLQNLTNKVRDNSVFLDWRTTYPGYRNSRIFELSDKLLSSQQHKTDSSGLGSAWDYYFPWKLESTNFEREFDPSFIPFLRLSYSRPRDIVTMVSLLQEEYIANNRPPDSVFLVEDFRGHEFQNKYSEYLMGGIKDQLAFYYDAEDYAMFLHFFNFLDGIAEFDYEAYGRAYNSFTDYVLTKHDDIPEFVETSEVFLQFLYDTNIICYIEDTELEPLFRWCYRERSPSNISPKVKLGLRYRIHYGLFKALNVGLTKHLRK